jgi:hypothetical protein
VFTTRAGAIIKRTLRSFYDDQMTHHAAALTYYERERELGEGVPQRETLNRPARRD